MNTHYQVYKPHEKLSGIVQFFWEFEADIVESMPYTHLSTASIYPKLAFQYQGNMEAWHANGVREILFNCGFQAQTNQSYQLVADHPVGVFGIYFYPHAIPLLFSIPADEITNSTIEISELIGTLGKELEDKMLTANSNTERIHIITSFLLHRLAQSSSANHGIIATAKHIVDNRGLVDINRLVEDNFLSQRHFERKFKALTGFSPKLFSRIVRFENSLSAYTTNKLSLTEVAYACGYYDQSHFIKDFREFSGQHPKAYFNEDISLFFSS